MAWFGPLLSGSAQQQAGAGEVTGTGALSAQVASATGAGLSVSLSTTGSLASQVSDLTGTGLSTSLSTTAVLNSTVSSLVGSNTTWLL